MSQRTVLIVDDSPEDRATCRRYLTRSGEDAFRVLEASSGKTALECLIIETPDCILLDFHLPDVDGLVILASLTGKNDSPRFPVVMLTGLGNTSVAVRSMKHGALDYLTKDAVSEETLVRAIDNAIGKHLLNQQVETQREELQSRNKELEDANEALQMRATVLQNMAEGVVMADQEGIIRFTNAALDRMFGYGEGELLEKHISIFNDLMPEEETHHLDVVIQEVYATGEWSGEFHNRTKTGSSFVTSVQISLLEVGKKTCWIAVQEDITERKRQQQQIADLNTRLHRAVFEGSHRIKNHLQVLSALVDLQLSDGEEQIPAEALRRVGSQIKALSAIHDVMTLTTKENAENDILPMKSLLERVLPLLQRSAGAHRIHFAVEEALLPSKHASSLVLILNELVSNAIKHGRGEVDVAFRAAEKIGTLEIRDNGPGFPSGFDPLKAANTGLDLVTAIARTDLGGLVAYDNHAAGGGQVTVSFSLPLAGRQEEPAYELA